MDSFVADIRFALRSLMKSKLSTGVALASLALGIGANVTVFSLVNALAFKPLPYPGAHRLVDLHEAPRFKFPEYAELWVPLAPNAVETTRAQRDFGVVVRINPGVSVSSADAEMVVLAKALEAQYPEQAEWTAHATNLEASFGAIPGSMYAALRCRGIRTTHRVRESRRTAARTRGIGVQIALGADRKHVVGLVAREGSRLVAFGIILGIGGSMVLLRAVQAMMFGASPIDVPVFAAVAVLLAVVAFAAIWAPSRRAAGISPLEALRAE